MDNELIQAIVGHIDQLEKKENALTWLVLLLSIAVFVMALKIR